MIRRRKRDRVIKRAGIRENIEGIEAEAEAEKETQRMKKGGTDDDTDQTRVRAVLDGIVMKAMAMSIEDNRDMVGIWVRD